METLSSEGDGKKDLDDSGCVQDVGPPPKHLEDENRPAELMDLSDDVLLLILKYCCPRDLKALGFTCPRLGRLVCDRTLWTHVDARAHPMGRARLRWLLAHALNATTTELLLSGYAREARGCLAHTNGKRKEVEEENVVDEKTEDSKEPAASTSDPSSPGSSREAQVQIIQVDPLSRLQQLYATGVVRTTNHNNTNTPHRFNGPSWPERSHTSSPTTDCCGPIFTLTQCMLRQLRAQCSLTSLALQHCNINCSTTGIAHFPPTLKKLSLRGAKCYNLPLDKSFLFNIQDYLPDLEYLDLSECDWLEPASLLPLSKVPRLKHLIMRDCCRLSEFVAYASLATRYGFRKLEILDLRGSPVADSEVSALGWLPSLQQLFVSPAPPLQARDPAPRPPARHELDPWEVQEPEYFKIKPQIIQPMDTRPNMSIDDIEEHIEQLRDYESNICLHGMEYNLCTEGISKTPPRKRPPSDEPEVPPRRSIFNIPGRILSDPEGRDANNIIVVSRTPEGNLTQTSYSEAAFINASLESRNAILESRNAALESRNAALERREESRNDEERAGPSPKRKRPNEKASNDLDKPSCSSSSGETSTSSKYKKRKIEEMDDSDNSDDESDPSEDSSAQKAVNEGASTSKNPPKKENASDENTENPKNSNSKEKVYEFVRFRQNMEPVIVRRDQEEVDREEREREQREREMANRNREAPPRAQVLYVNVGQQLHTVYHLSIHSEPPMFYSHAGNHLRFRPNVGNIFYTPPTPHLDATSLVTDSAVRRFGRADVDDVNYIHIGPRNGVDPGARPNRSSLRVLSITGFRNITDRSLIHLATAAPELRLIDFSETRVTASGVENFKTLRPDCEVIFSEYVEREE